MRLHFKLSPNMETVPYSYQHYLTGAFHKWVGQNDLHDGMSLYSLGWLSGGVTMRQGQRIQGGLDFPKGATWFISAYDPDVLHRVCLQAMKDSEVCCGMNVIEIRIVPEPEVSEKQVFRVASPVLARSKEVEGKVKHLIYSDKAANDVLTQTLRHKLDKAGLSDLAPDTSVQFDHNFVNPHTKLVTINGIANRASVCPVIVEGPVEAVRFAWNVGIGHLTGSGFGALN